MLDFRSRTTFVLFVSMPVEHMGMDIFEWGMAGLYVIDKCRMMQSAKDVQ